ncbi:MAG: uroporphyrinogen decarboxylase [Pirellulales bacterium]|nr:uroporphyrinogen decarboxylase [Pirellulales bacterium]
MHPPWQNSLLMRAARREPVERTPIWLMRQAGRYLPEYRAVRQKMPFAALCKNPDLAAGVMLATVDRLKVDAAILFSDLLVLLEPLGFEVEYAPGGPVIKNPLRMPDDVDRVRELEDAAELDYVLETVRKTRSGLDAGLPLIGFAGAPFTLAAYLIEGGVIRDYRRTKSFLYTDRGAWDALLGRLARAAGRLLEAQVASGAQLVQLFDSWVGCLGVEDYREHVLPYSREAIALVPPETPVIHFTTGNPALLSPAAEAGRGRKHLILGVDWRIRLEDAWRTIGHETAIQGNLDPAVLLGPPEEVRRRTEDVLRQAAGRPGHIFNLGHGVLPQTPVENVRLLIETVQAGTGPG